METDIMLADLRAWKRSFLSLPAEDVVRRAAQLEPDFAVPRRAAALVGAYRMFLLNPQNMDPRHHMFSFRGVTTPLEPGDVKELADRLVQQFEQLLTWRRNATFHTPGGVNDTD